MAGLPRPPRPVRLAPIRLKLDRGCSNERVAQQLTAEQADRAAGVLLGGAVGDALGMPYEFGTPPGPGEFAEMTGGGLGNFVAGEWSDDTSMAVAIAEVAATGADLTTPEAL